MIDDAFDWRALIDDKLVDPDTAVQHIDSGDTVAVAPFTCTPNTLCEALLRRQHELGGVTVFHPVALFPWHSDKKGAFDFRTFFATGADRDEVNSGDVEYVPIAHWQANVWPSGFPDEVDVYLVPVSPPDRNGYCSFGSGVWFSPSLVERARVVIAEIREDFIRTGGQNFVHISQIDSFTEAVPKSRRAGLPERKDEDAPIVEIICTLVATELINDRDTIQLGVGTVSAAVAPFLAEKSDLGVHTEIITGGILDLVRSGTVTGKYKTVHRGKVVGSSLAAIARSERSEIDGNPIFELYEFNYVNDIRVIMQHENMVAVNNALMVDLTGQVASESIGTRVWAGSGGQTSFAIGALNSKGGRSVIVLPSSSHLDGRITSRIVPVLPSGSTVTVQRNYADFVVTEHGIASLRGKSYRERMRELISVAHPTLRSELRIRAQEEYGTSP